MVPDNKPCALMNLPIVNASIKMDGKGRMALPTPLQAYFGLVGTNQLIAFANGGPSGGLALYSQNEYEDLLSKYRNDPVDPKSRLFALAICSTATTVSIDSSGRILVPKNLRELLNLSKELHIFSAGSWIEIWDYDRWAKEAYPQSTDVWSQLNSFTDIQSFSTDAQPNT